MSPDSGGESPPARSARRESPLKPLDLMAVLRSHRVEFVVIGGFSLAAHGYVRGTKDLDIVPQASQSNLERLMEALQTLDAEPLAIGDFRAEEVLELGVGNLLLGGNWLLRTRLGRLDVMQYVEGIDGYDELRAGAVEIELEGLDDPPPFAGYDDLIAMKQAAGRDQDLRDIAELERARGG